MPHCGRRLGRRAPAEPDGSERHDASLVPPSIRLLDPTKKGAFVVGGMLSRPFLGWTSLQLLSGPRKHGTRQQRSQRPVLVIRPAGAFCATPGAAVVPRG